MDNMDTGRFRNPGLNNMGESSCFEFLEPSHFDSDIYFTHAGVVEVVFVGLLLHSADEAVGSLPDMPGEALPRLGDNQLGGAATTLELRCRALIATSRELGAREKAAEDTAVLEKPLQVQWRARQEEAIKFKRDVIHAAHLHLDKKTAQAVLDALDKSVDDGKKQFKADKQVGFATFLGEETRRQELEKGVSDAVKKAWAALGLKLMKKGQRMVWRRLRAHGRMTHEEIMRLGQWCPIEAPRLTISMKGSSNKRGRTDDEITGLAVAPPAADSNTHRMTQGEIVVDSGLFPDTQVQETPQ